MANRTLYGDNGKQVLLFPLDYMYITQVSGPSSFSHCCGNPIDVVGNYSYYPIYAPCDCHLIYSDNVGNSRIYQSDDEVNYATGVGYVCFGFTHDNNPPSKTSFKQGELIAHTGTAGYVTGEHCHLDQSIGQNNQLVSYGYYCSYGNLCYAQRNSTPPEKMWFVNYTTIGYSYGLTFKTYDGGTPGPSPEPTKKVTKKKMPVYMMCGRKPF